MWNASSRLPSTFRISSTHALIRSAWARRSSSARSASRWCSRRSSRKPTRNAPTVPTAEKTSAKALSQLLSKVYVLRRDQEVVQSHAHRTIHRQRVELGYGGPPDVGGF